MNSPKNPLKLLVVDIDPEYLELLRESLQQEGLEITTALGAEVGLKTFATLHPQIVLVELLLPEMGGIEVQERILATDPGTDVLLMTAQYSPESAVEAIKKGAADYLVKPLDIEKLRKRLQDWLADARTRSEALRLEHQLVSTYQFEGIVGRSPLMLDVFAKIRRVAPHFRTALVTGATGTGKELVARALHRLSPAAAGPFIVCNCSALVETLAESELFGYVKGAFTGAVQDRKGIFELANGGTVFLDEIGELPLAGQAKLLRVLQTHEVQRVGSPTPRAVDIRVIAATNRELETMVKEERFREDLYYRMAMTEIELPRLADRKEDLPLLQRYFVKQFAEAYGKAITGFTRRSQIRMSAYTWPGNVRQLENVIGNACMMTDGPVLDLDDLPEGLREVQEPIGETDELVSLDTLRNRYVKQVLERVGGNKARAAEILGIGRGTLYQFLSKIQSGETHEVSTWELSALKRSRSSST